MSELRIRWLHGITDLVNADVAPFLRRLIEAGSLGVSVGPDEFQKYVDQAETIRQRHLVAIHIRPRFEGGEVVGANFEIGSRVEILDPGKS